MTIDEFARQFPEKMRRLREFAGGDAIKDITGMEAVNAFRDNFSREGYVDRNDTFNPWRDVKRRDQQSAWYGHSGQTGRFSAARTTASVLTGETQELQNSIGYRKLTNGVRVGTSLPYASVHQFGLQAKVYGRKAFQMPARPFIVPSGILMRNINEKIIREIKNIVKS